MAGTATPGHAWNSQTVEQLDGWVALLPDPDMGAEEVVLAVDADSAASVAFAVKCAAVDKSARSHSIHRFDSDGVTPLDYFVLHAGQQVPFAASIDNRIVQIYASAVLAPGETTTAAPTTTASSTTAAPVNEYTGTFSGTVTKA